MGGLAALRGSGGESGKGVGERSGREGRRGAKEGSYKGIGERARGGPR